MVQKIIESHHTVIETAVVIMVYRKKLLKWLRLPFESIQKIIKAFEIGLGSPICLPDLLYERLDEIISADRRTNYDSPVEYAHKAPDSHRAMQRAQYAVIFFGKFNALFQKLSFFRRHV